LRVEDRTPNCFYIYHVQKKSFHKSSKSEKKTSSPPADRQNIPYKKWDKKKKNPVLVAAAKKMFERSAADDAKKSASKKIAANGKSPNSPYIKKQESRGGRINKPTSEVYFTEAKITDEIRLNKYLSHAGVASRRAADELIKEGRVTVNGTVVREMGYKVKLKDKVSFDGKILSLEKKYYLLLNKPKDYITTMMDEKDRRTVMDLLRGAYEQINALTKPRLYPVGRLDRNTTGVLLITNDGELAQKLTHPSTEVQKIYHVVLDKNLRKEDFNKIAEGGVVLEDGIAEVDEIAYPNPKNKAEIGVQIHTGKNRFIRRLFEAMDYEVEKLDRVFFAGLTKKDLPRGRWRFLNEDEVRLLKHFV
jgi:23S rRNA pseudouridine2605 synthase